MVFPREQFLGAITELDENQSGVITCNDAIITEVIGYQGTARLTQPVGSSGIGIFWVENPGGGNPTLAKFTNSNNQTITLGQNNINLDGYAPEADLLAHTTDSTIHFTAESLGLDGYALTSDIPILNINLDGYALETDLLAHTGNAAIHFTAASLGLDGYALISDIITDHGGLTGLLDDDHTQYLLINGTRSMTGTLNMGTYGITNAASITSSAGTLGLISTISQVTISPYNTLKVLFDTSYLTKYEQSGVLSNINQVTDNGVYENIKSSRNMTYSKYNGTGSVLVGTQLNYT